jgi:hypothetical protein
MQKTPFFFSHKFLKYKLNYVTNVFKRNKKKENSPATKLKTEILSETKTEKQHNQPEFH